MLGVFWSLKFAAWVERKESSLVECLFVCLFCFLELQNLSVFFFPFEPHICFWIFRKLGGFREFSCLLQLLKGFCDCGSRFFLVCRRKMAMAGVCAKVLQPVGGLRTQQQQQQQRSGGAAAAVGRKKRTATRSSGSAVVSDTAAFSRARTISSYGTAAAAGRRCYYGSSGPLLCQASSGGSRRDYQKIVARTQHRRASKVFYSPIPTLIIVIK